MLRRILAVVAGIVVASVIVFVVELVIPLICPLPDELATAVKEYPPDVEKIRALADQFPPGAFIGVLLGWTLGALAGALVATLIAGKTSQVPGLVFGGIFLAVCATNLVLLQIHPPWFWVATLVLVPAATYLGTRVVARKRPAV